MARTASSVRTKAIPVTQQLKNTKPVAGKVKMIDLLEHNLKDMYWVEKKLSATMPKIIRQVESEELRTAMENHLGFTAKQITNLETIFRAIEVKPKGQRCKGIEGLIHECEDVISRFDQPMLDPAILASVQKIEQYEITAYTSLIELAKSLDLLRPAKILRDILKEEQEAFKQLEELTDLHVQRAYLWQVDFD